MPLGVIILAAGYGVIVGWGLTIQLRPVYGLLLALEMVVRSIDDPEAEGGITGHRRTDPGQAKGEEETADQLNQKHGSSCNLRRRYWLRRRHSLTISERLRHR